MCMKCLVNEVSIVINFKNIGYPSVFDNLFDLIKSVPFKLKLCNECYKKTQLEWWDFELVKSDDGYVFKYEDEIFEYITDLPVKSIREFYGELLGEDLWTTS